MKKIWGLLLAVCMMFCLLPATAMATDRISGSAKIYDLQVGDHVYVNTFTLTNPAAVTWSYGVKQSQADENPINSRINISKNGGSTTLSETINGVKTKEYWIVGTIKFVSNPDVDSATVYFYSSIQGYSISLNYNGGSGTASELTTDVDGKLETMPTPNERAGYEFLGWYDAQTGGNKVSTDTVFANSATIYAHWQAHSWDCAKSIDETTLYLYCTNDGCKYYKDEAMATNSDITISPSANDHTYDGIAYSASANVTVSGQVQSTTGISTAWKYTYTYGDVVDSETAPTNVGNNYTAKCYPFGNAAADNAMYGLKDVFVETSFNITPKTLIPEFTAVKNYDGKQDAVLTAAATTAGGLVSGDEVTFSGTASGTYDSKDAGTNKKVTGIVSTGITVSGKDKDNYNVSFPAAIETGTINRRPLTAEVNADKIYDGTATGDVTASVVTGVEGESIRITGLTGTFDDVNAGTGINVAVNFAGKQITAEDGTSLDNYDVTIPSSLTAEIFKAPQSAPAVPTLKSRTKHEIVLNTISARTDCEHNAVEYSIDGENYQDSQKFENLSTETTYKFYARYKESRNYLPSDASTASISTVSRSGIAMSTIHVYTEGKGTASPNGTIQVLNGNDKTITFTPDAGYEIGDVVVNNKSVGAVSSYTVKDIDGNVNIEVTFVKNGNAVVGTESAANPSTGAAI